MYLYSEYSLVMNITIDKQVSIINVRLNYHVIISLTPYSDYGITDSVRRTLTSSLTSSAYVNQPLSQLSLSSRLGY